MKSTRDSVINNDFVQGSTGVDQFLKAPDPASYEDLTATTIIQEMRVTANVAPSELPALAEADPFAYPTITGITGADNIQGTAGADVIVGTAGADTINGNGGNDTINGGDGSDFLFGDNHNDNIKGAAGDETLDGEAGAEQVYGDAGKDTVLGGDGNDRVYGGASDDAGRGGLLEDRVYGAAGNIKLFGDGPGDVSNDQLVRGDGDDRAVNTIDGAIGNESADGGAGFHHCSSDPDPVSNCES